MRLPRLVALAAVPLAACNWGFVAPWSSPPNGSATAGPDTAGLANQYDAYLRGTPEGITQTASLWAAAEGIGFAPDGQHGVAGLVSMACRFDVHTGAIDLDLDPDQAGTEQVDDATGTNANLLVVTSTDEGVQVTRFLQSGGDVVASYSASGVLDACFVGSSVVALQQAGDCAVQWYPSGSSAKVGRVCGGAVQPVGDGGFAVAEDGRVFVIADGKVHVVAPGVSVDTGVSADLLAWDPVHALLFTATRSEHVVRAVQPDGHLVWSADVAGNVTALTSLPDRGQAVVGLSVGTGGRLLVLDGANGHVVGQADAYEAPNHLYAAPSAGVFAARTSYDTHLLQADR